MFHLHIALAEECQSSPMVRADYDVSRPHALVHKLRIIHTGSPLSTLSNFWTTMFTQAYYKILASVGHGQGARGLIRRLGGSGPRRRDRARAASTSLIFNQEVWALRLFLSLDYHSARSTSFLPASSLVCDSFAYICQGHGH